MRVIHQEQPRHLGGPHDRPVRHHARRTCSRWTPTTLLAARRPGRAGGRAGRAPLARRRCGAACASSARWSSRQRRRPRRSTRGASPTSTTCPTPACSGATPSLDVGGWSLPGAFQDWDLWMALAEAGFTPPRCSIGRTLHYRRHGGRQFASRRGAPRRALRASCGAATRACSRPAGATGGARRDPLRVRLGLPLATAIPGLSRRHRHRLFTLVDSPRRRGRPGAPAPAAARQRG